MLNHIRGKRKKGFALVIVLVIFAVVAIMGTTMLTVSVSQSKQTEHRVAYEKAYYLARSGVDVVAEDLKERIGTLGNLKTALDNAQTDAEYSQALIVYNDAVGFINNLVGKEVLLQDTIGHDSDYVSKKVQITGQTAADVTTIYISSTVIKDGATASAKVKFGDFSTIPKLVTVPNTSIVPKTINTNAIYAFKNITLGNNITVAGRISAPGTITMGNNTTSAGEPETTVHYTPNLSASPPDSIMASPPAQRPVVDPDGWIRTSGYYTASYNTAHSKEFKWEVDTRNGDVTLVFDSISADQASSITVWGENNLYIYLVPSNNTSTLIDLQNGFTISNKDVNDKIPHTYISTYDSTVRNIAGDTNKVKIKNNSTMFAYFYMPFTEIDFKNQGNLTGCIYANIVNCGNGNNNPDGDPEIKYHKPDSSKFGANKIDPNLITTSNPKNNTYDATQYNSTGILWVR